MCGGIEVGTGCIGQILVRCQDAKTAAQARHIVVRVGVMERNFALAVRLQDVGDRPLSDGVPGDDCGSLRSSGGTLVDLGDLCASAAQAFIRPQTYDRDHCLVGISLSQGSPDRSGFHFASAKSQAGRGERADQVIAFEVGVSPQCGGEASAPAVDQAIALGDRCEWYRQMFGECSDVVNGLRPLNLAEVSVCGAPAVHWVVDAVEPGCRGECGRR